jgi:hypothetical protein
MEKRSFAAAVGNLLLDIGMQYRQAGLRSAAPEYAWSSIPSGSRRDVCATFGFTSERLLYRQALTGSLLFGAIEVPLEESFSSHGSSARRC